MKMVTTMRVVSLAVALGAFQCTAGDWDFVEELDGGKPAAKPGGGEKGEKGRGGAGGGRQGGMMESPEQVMSNLRVESPDKFKELRALRESNPEQFREKLQSLMEERRAKMQAERKAMKDLADKYRSTKDEKVKAELKAKLTQTMQAHLDSMEKQLKIQEESLKKNKEDVAAKRANLDQEVESKLKMLLSDSGAAQDGGPGAGRGHGPKNK